MKNNFINRRGFLQICAGAGIILPQISESAEPDNIDPHLLSGPDEGEIYLIGPRKGKVTIKVARENSGRSTMSLLTEDITPGDGIPVHKHGTEDEWVYISRGLGRFTFGDEIYDVGPGSMALVPKNVWHGVRNEGDEMLQMVFGYSPAGFEGYFREIGIQPGEQDQTLTPADWQRINSKYKVTYK